ncbi:MAG: VWA domain-containing protein [Planctomycetes bacterium]|nr:VWA domain-containing protein [Planctomycetota bacterium]
MTYLLEHWLGFACLLAAIGLTAALAVHRYRHGVWAWGYYLPAAVLASYGIGAVALFAPWWVGPALALAAFVAMVVLLVVVILSGFWTPLLAYAALCLLCFGMGEFSHRALADALSMTFFFLVSLRPQEPWWLLLLIAAPVLVWTSWRNLVTLGPARRWLVLGLRVGLIVLLALALSEAYARKPNENVTVIFVWDRSLSMPPEFERGKDQREARIFNFINQSVVSNKRRDDRVGVIVFGKHPRLELPPHAVKKLGFSKILSKVDNSYTDIAAALKLGLASFPEGSGKRIVLISDGNENMGRAEEQARLAKQNGVQIDIVPIAAGRKHQNEILVERIEAPSVTQKGARLPLRVVVRSFHPQVVVAELNLRKITFDAVPDPKGADKHSTIVKLRQGLQVFTFQETGARDDSAFAYEATVVPLHVETPEGVVVHRKLPGDRVDNNEARAVVMSRGQRAILLIETEPGRHQLLVNRLQALEAGLKVKTLTINRESEKPEKGVNELHQLTRGDNETLATYLSKFDAVVLANLPADCLTEDEQKVIRSHVHDQGAGLIMIGGNQSFGAGGWQNTEIEKALPVDMELKSMKIEGKSGLVLIMHASEMQDGNAWQRKIAKLAIEKLSPMDMMGLIHYDHGFAGGAPGHNWHIAFQDVGPNRKKLLGLVDSMQPGDMPDVDPAFDKAHKKLTNKEYGLGTKHIIFISDGDHWDASPAMMNRLRKDKISCTTVCITSHGRDEVKKMAAVAAAAFQPGGRAYHVTDPKLLPAIYIKETRLVSQSFVHEKPFQPHLIGSRDGPTEGIAGPLPQLHGFVRTTARDSSLVKVQIETEKIGQYTFPILASWQYGLGKSVAFTSDARTIPGEKFWDRDWAGDPIHGRFWDQTVNWALRPKETGEHLFLTTEQKDGKIRIIIEARDSDKTPLTDLDLKAGITSPAFKVKDDRKTELKFEQKNAGVYEAEIPADEVGAYFINVQAKWTKDGKPVTDNVRAGVSIPYSPEFAEMDSNPTLLERLRELTGGKSYRDDADVLEQAARAADVFRATPMSHASLEALWPWLVFLTALCLLLDVAIRRIAIQPEAVWAKAVAVWQKLRGQASAEEKLPEYIERLKSRKSQVGETMDKKKAAKKFEAAEGTPTLEAPSVASSAPVEKPKKPASKPKPTEDEDFATRLMRAKKKAMEERDKDKK